MNARPMFDSSESLVTAEVYPVKTASVQCAPAVPLGTWTHPNPRTMLKGIFFKLLYDRHILKHVTIMHMHTRKNLTSIIFRTFGG